MTERFKVALRRSITNWVLAVAVGELVHYHKFGCAAALAVLVILNSIEILRPLPPREPKSQ